MGWGGGGTDINTPLKYQPQGMNFEVREYRDCIDCGVF